MAVAVTISTPLGPLDVAVEVDGASVRDGASPRRSSLPSGAEVVVWADVGGLTVDALVTPMTPFVGAPMELPETSMWGIEWRLHAAAASGAVVVSALLPDAGPSWLAGDEDLVTAEFGTADWALAIGGPDEEFLSRLASEARQPSSWRDLTLPTAEPDGGRGLVWRLPGIPATETARMHVAVAWCRAGHPRSEDAAWLAVDTSPAAIRAAAGVAGPHEERRAARGT